ncbi:hypothetical protein J1N35_022895 [Gossypium stocksii]|uniref:DNA-directed DNA polymerase n=1 Tax=Gossypium stocksii TaxID=47602 RepID=A0A9D3VJB0_9ROSI|nr:hypothetical protein J1N35_022895 [Gossypium stocksii]
MSEKQRRLLKNAAKGRRNSGIFRKTSLKFRTAIQLQFDFFRAIYNLGTVLYGLAEDTIGTGGSTNPKEVSSNELYNQSAIYVAAAHALKPNYSVLEAKAGFYEKPIATLDFASLYPSIMMAYNLCYCTLVTPEDVRKLNLPPECVNRTPSGETFVKPELQKGILPEILEELLTARKQAKADLKL